MKIWKKGAIIGGIWGLLGSLIYVFGSILIMGPGSPPLWNLEISKYLFTVQWYSSIFLHFGILGFVFLTVFSIIVWFLVGAIIGTIINHFRKKSEGG